MLSYPGQIYSPGYYALNSASGLALNASSVAYRGMLYHAPHTKTLNTVRVYCTATSGTVTNIADCVVCEQTSRFATSGTMTVLSTSSAATPSAGSWMTLSGLSQVLTKNKTYGIMIHNNSGTPGTNYFSVVSAGAFGANPIMLGQLSNNGTSITGWTQNMALRLGFSDGTFVGIPISAVGADTGLKVYGTREMGRCFLNPATISAAGMYIGTFAQTGTPTGNPRLRYYTGDSSKSIVETISDVFGTVSGGAGACTWRGYFSSPLTIDAAVYQNIVLGESTNSDTSSNAFTPSVTTWDSDSDSLALIRHDSKVTYYDGSTWTNDSTKHIYQAGFILEDGNEYPVSGASGPSRGQWLSRLQSGK